MGRAGGGGDASMKSNRAVWRNIYLPYRRRFGEAPKFF